MNLERGKATTCGSPRRSMPRCNCSHRTSINGYQPSRTSNPLHMVVVDMVLCRFAKIFGNLSHSALSNSRLIESHHLFGDRPSILVDIGKMMGERE